MVKVLVAIYIILNLLAFLVYAVDKRKAIKGKRRIPESTLLFLGLLAGGIGGIVGMMVCHHKTRKIYFWMVNILALCLHIALICLIHNLFFSA